MRLLFWLLCFSSTLHLAAQQARISGRVTGEEGEAIAGANVLIGASGRGTLTDEEGYFSITELPEGEYEVVARLLGFRTERQQITLGQGEACKLTFRLKPDNMNLDEVVVSGTRYSLDRKESPVVVNVLRPKTLKASQSMAISEGLNYQSGVRVETNCQNCGFTQVRLNGLGGAYSQILINSRPVFSALNSVYGLDQIPTNMVERIEIVRGGGSALYGSNAIAGTINIITRQATENSWQVGSNFALIDGQVPDKTVTYNASLVSDNRQSGVSFYGMNRQRGVYDANNDGFSEITRLENNTLGIKSFYQPSERSEITFNFNSIHEYRRGGDRLELAPHLTDITEELAHRIINAGINLDWRSEDSRSVYSLYFSSQFTDRQSYYGGLGGGRTEQDSNLAANAYGQTDDRALVGGAQFTHYLQNRDVLTLGVEYQSNKVADQIPGYQRLVDQHVSTLGSYLQYEWKMSHRLKLLLGGRYDLTFVDGNYRVGNISRQADQQAAVLSPRIAVMYDLNSDIQLRAGYARGFRAPQAFNEDLHISSVGGEAQFVIISEDLRKELSDAYTFSVNYSRLFGSSQFNALAEVFLTELKNPFTTVSTGATLSNGSIVQELQNGQGAYVGGLNVELNYSPRAKWQFQMGGTLQKARYKAGQALFTPGPGNESESEVLVHEFVRNPDVYGYFTAFWQAGKHWAADVTGTFTGPMTVPLVVSPTGFMELRQSPAFLDVNLKLSYDWHLPSHFEIKFSAGVQNLLNSYQRDFDRGANRDSDYVYGPARPRTFFVGIEMGSSH